MIPLAPFGRDVRIVPGPSPAVLRPRGSPSRSARERSARHQVHLPNRHRVSYPEAWPSFLPRLVDLCDRNLALPLSSSIDSRPGRFGLLARAAVGAAIAGRLSSVIAGRVLRRRRSGGNISRAAATADQAVMRCGLFASRRTGDRLVAWLARRRSRRPGSGLGSICAYRSFHLCHGRNRRRIVSIVPQESRHEIVIPRAGQSGIPVRRAADHFAVPHGEPMVCGPPGNRVGPGIAPSALCAQ